jgi:enamine deaminase RidA (YjgF/YER057c/UK114 family)
MTREERFRQIAVELGYDFDGEIKVGGNYSPLVVHDNITYISGQIPRVGDTVVIQGAVGKDVSLAQGQLAAKICIMRAVALLLGRFKSLDKVKRILSIDVYVQSADGFTRQSEVSDGASEILYAIFGEDGVHARTSVGVFQLPKNAPVEISLVVATF